MVIRKKRVDEDWKNQAEKEKEKFAAEEDAERRRREGTLEETESSSGPPPGAVPLTPIFEQLGAQAMAGLGQVPDPRTGMRNVDLDMAAYAIDLLSSIDAKTRGRLDDQEARILEELLSALRGAYAQIEQALRGHQPPPA